MRGTSGQEYTDNIVILQFKNLDNLCSPARRTRLWQAGLCPKKGNSYTIYYKSTLADLNFLHPQI